MGYTTALGYTPIYMITKDGEDITGNFNDRTLSIEVELREGGGDQDTIDIVIDDRDWIIESPSIGEGSTTLQIFMGYTQNALYDMGSYQIDTLKYTWTPKSFVLHGNALGWSTAAKAPVITSYEGKTIGDIVGSIAQAAGVTAKVDPSFSSIVVPFLNQSSSHMHLLQELERRYDALAKFDNGSVSFTQRGTGTSVSGLSIGSFTLYPEDFGTGSIKLSSRDAYSKVRAAYWDKTQNQTVWLDSTTPGAANSTIPYMIKKAFPSQAEAQAGANSAMAQLNRRNKTGQVTLAKGDPSIRAGQIFAIAGCRDGIDGVYTIKTAVHSFVKDTGIMTTLEIYDDADNATVPASTTDPEQVDFSGVVITT